MNCLAPVISVKLRREAIRMAYLQISVKSNIWKHCVYFGEVWECLDKIAQVNGNFADLDHRRKKSLLSISETSI